MARAVKIYKHFETPKEPGIYYRLVCLTGSSKGEAYFLMGQRVVLGRSEQCDITIKDLKSSREHAEITHIGGNYILTDLGSQNGIIVNDLKVKQHSLTSGDKVIVGKTVYKFAQVVVKEETVDLKKKKVIIDEEDDDEFESSEEEVEPKNKKLTLVLGVVLILGVVLLIGDDTKDVKKRNKSAGQREVKEIDNSFEKAIRKKTIADKKNKEKLGIYFKRGLREFREGNYFRAISEFESAQQWSPNDSLANFYLRKTREKLEEQIKSYFSKATRDTDAISYLKAVTSYCAVIRLLNRYQNDVRYLTAKEGIKKLEQKMGLDEGEIVCIEPKRE